MLTFISRGLFALRNVPTPGIPSRRVVLLPLASRPYPTKPQAAIAADSPSPSNTDFSPEVVSDIARKNLEMAANACRRCGWLAFWVQLVLNTVAAVIVIFSLAFATTSNAGPSITNVLTMCGIGLGFLSTFWSFGYMRLAKKLRQFLIAPSLEGAPRIRRSDVINMLEKGVWINIIGSSCALLALQAIIGLLVAKTLTSATVNPFMASTMATWNPVLAFDVFQVQATTNALLSHFISLVSSLILLRIIANRPATRKVVSSKNKMFT